MRPSNSRRSRCTSITDRAFVSDRFPTTIYRIVRQSRRLSCIVPLNRRMFQLMRSTISRSNAHRSTSRRMSRRQFGLVLTRLLLLMRTIRRRVARRRTCRPTNNMMSSKSEARIDRSKVQIPCSVIGRVYRRGHCALGQGYVVSPSYAVCSLPSVPDLPTSHATTSRPCLV